jgi:hypothetical protein
MSAEQSRALPRWLAVVLGASLLLSVYGYASFELPRGVNLMRHSSGVYDMDVPRVVADVTTRLPAYRPAVHPLQKLLLAPLGQYVNTRFFGGTDRLAAAKVLIALGVTLNALLVGVLAFRLARRSLAAGVVAGAVCGLSFSSLLAASVPESAALSSLGAVVPLLFLERRMDRSLTWNEAGVWGGIAVFCVAITITQGVYWMIALAVRLFLLRRAGVEPGAGGVALRVALALAIAVSLIWGGARLQSRLYPGTETFYDSGPLESARGYFRIEELGRTPLGHTARLIRHFALYSFLAPRPAYSDFLMRDFGLDYWSLSIEASDRSHWRPAPRVLAALLLLGFLVACVRYAKMDARFLAPGLCVASQFALHLLYGREYILYSPNWHGVLVAVVVAAAWNGLGARGRVVASAAAAMLCAALLANNLTVMNAVYREFDAGLEAERRDAKGRLLP